MKLVMISHQFTSHGDTAVQFQYNRLDYRYFDKNLMLGLARSAC